jgi:hypothetical protein
MRSRDEKDVSEEGVVLARRLARGHHRLPRA